MNFSKIKKYITELGNKCVIVEDGEPVLVVMSFSDYENLARPFLPDMLAGAKRAPPAAAREDPVAPPRRQDEWQIADAPETEFISDDPPAVPLARPRLDEIRLEDLPL